jgi:hypothetical protein
LFFGANIAEMLGPNPGLERLHGHLRALGDRGTSVEAVVTLGWFGHGAGVVRTGDGREFRVVF